MTTVWGEQVPSYMRRVVLCGGGSAQHLILFLGGSPPSDSLRTCWLVLMVGSGMNMKELCCSQSCTKMEERVLSSSEFPVTGGI